MADLIMGGHEYFVFSGNFDGNGYTIKNLTIGTETSPYSGDVCGLFGATSGTMLAEITAVDMASAWEVRL